MIADPFLFKIIVQKTFLNICLTTISFDLTTYHFKQLHRKKLIIPAEYIHMPQVKLLSLIFLYRRYYLRDRSKKKKAVCRNSRPLTIACHMKKGKNLVEVTLVALLFFLFASVLPLSVMQMYSAAFNCHNHVFHSFIIPNPVTQPQNPYSHWVLLISTYGIQRSINVTNTLIVCFSLTLFNNHEPKICRTSA
ncbi:hypothetical protein SAMN05660816_05160 [Niastella yeongjuensis]|nr:hypothetical protein SAMN05660816_05160 [Niastella yeongjuensis]